MEKVREFSKRQGVLLGVIVSALCGAVLAAGGVPDLQVPVESGQVLAGIVTYPADNPFAVYHLKLWTLLNQLAAFLLQAGLADGQASLLIEGVLGAISFVAIFLLVLAVSGRTSVALFAPLFIHFLDLVGIPIAYPIWLMGTSHSYGILGLSSALLVLALFGVGRQRSGAFLAGMIPALHPSLGAFTWVVMASAVLLHRRALRPLTRPLLLAFGAGVVVTAASLLWQLHFFPDLPGLEPALKRQYLEAFIHNFDLHRSFSGWGHPGLLTAILVAAIAVVAGRRGETPLGTRLALTALASSVAVTVAAAGLAEFTPFGAPLKMLMPWRYLNLANLAAVPLALGLLASGAGARPRSRAALLLVVVFGALLWRLFLPLDPQWLYLLILLAVLLVLALPLPDLPEAVFGLLPRWQGRITMVLMAILLLLRVLPATQFALANAPEAMVPEIYRFAAERPGMLLTAGNLHLIQLQTRRPVLMDGGGLDFFTYVPETGPRFNEILGKVYGLDLFVPPAGEQLNRGELTFEHQALWERRSPAEWRQLGEEFGVTDILTPVGWQLKLPLLAQDDNVSLYTIP